MRREGAQSKGRKVALTAHEEGERPQEEMKSRSEMVVAVTHAVPSLVLAIMMPQ